MQDKPSLRKEFLSRRDSIPAVIKQIKDRSITERLFSLPDMQQAKTVFFFASFRSEVDTFGMMQKALAQGVRIVLPKVEGKDLGLYLVQGLDELKPGYMGIPEPTVLADDRRVTVNDVDAVIVPGAAFDPSGNRVGYGGGYYDRLLAGLQRAVPIIAPTYEEQIVAAVPADPHDRKVQIIVTDLREIRCGTASG